MLPVPLPVLTPWESGFIGRTAQQTQHIIAGNTIAWSALNYASLTDVSVSIPAVLVGDLWCNKQIGIEFGVATATHNDNYYYGTDNVRLTSTPTPEPGVLALLAAGLAGLLCYAWRKSR